MSLISRNALCAGWYAMAALLTAPSLRAQSFATPPAPDPFVRYATPGQCEQAAIRLDAYYWRDKRIDTVRFAPETDSVPLPVVQAARACAARFSVATVPERELLNLAQLYAWAKQDDLMQAALDRLLAAELRRSPLERGWTLQLIATSLLDVKPSQLQVAQKYLAQLDALGVAAATSRLFAHTAFSEYATTVNDQATAIAEGRAALRAASQMSSDDRIDWATSILQSYQVLAEAIALQHGGAEARALFDTAKADLLPLRPAGSRAFAGLQRAVVDASQPYTLWGTQGATLQATQWYNVHGDEGARPRAGKTSLLVFVNASCGARCYPMYATIRRLQAKYASEGLSIVFLASTRGYFRNKQLPVVSTERDSIRHYFSDFQRFDVPLAVEDAKLTRASDGRVQAAPTANRRAYLRDRTGVLVDGRGIVTVVDTLAPNRERVWDAAIRKALKP